MRMCRDGNAFAQLCVNLNKKDNALKSPKSDPIPPGRLTLVDSSSSIASVANCVALFACQKLRGEGFVHLCIFLYSTNSMMLSQKQFVKIAGTERVLEKQMYYDVRIFPCLAVFT